MGIRNFHLFGKAYSETGSDVTVSVTIQGYGEVFNGAVPTVQSATPSKNTVSESLASWATDDEVGVSAKTLTIAPTGGDVFIVSSGADKIDKNDLTSIADFSSIQAKSDMSIDGVPYDFNDDIDGAGGIEGWHVQVSDGETLLLTLTAPELHRLVPGGRWPTDPTHPTYNAAKAGLMTPSYEQGDALPDPIVPPAE